MKRTILAASLVCLAVTSLSRAAVTVLPAGSSVGGKTIGEWTADWWNWTGKGPSNVFSDTDGSTATQNQSGPVFFVAGTQGGAAVTRSFEVPGDKYVLFPVLNVVVANGPDPGFADTLTEAGAIVDGQYSQGTTFATLDGVDVPDIASHREKSPQNFTYTVDPGLGGFPAGTYNDANSDGYWLMLAPLSEGAHTLHFGGAVSDYPVPNAEFTFPGFSVDVTDNVRVAAGPPTAIPLPPAVLGGLPMLAAAWGAVRASRRRG